MEIVISLIFALIFIISLIWKTIFPNESGAIFLKNQGLNSLDYPNLILDSLTSAIEDGDHE